MTHQRLQRFQQTLDRRQPDLTVITDQIHKARNLAAIVRTCDAVGIGRIHITEPKDGYSTCKGTAMGSTRWVETVLHDNVLDGMQLLKQQGMTVFAATLSDEAVDFCDVDYTGPCAILLGAEKNGVSTEAASYADQHIVIPMQGMVESYNVSVAAAIVLTEVRRQRQQKGLYDQRRVMPDEYQRILFRWAQPKVAQWCDANSVSYPELDDEGSILSASQWYASVRNELSLQDTKSNRHQGLNQYQGSTKDQGSNTLMIDDE